MRYSSDLRVRVVNFVKAGGSKAEAARRFKVSRTVVFNWLRAGEAVASYQKPGPRGANKLDRAALATDVATNPDLTQAERARKFGVSRHCIWHNLRWLEISRKKNDAVRAVLSYEKKDVFAPAGAVRTAR